MKSASVFVLWLIVFHIGATYAKPTLSVGDCVTTDEMSAFMRDQNQKPIATMNRITTKLSISSRLQENITIDGKSAPRWIWLQTYNGTLKHWDAHVTRYQYKGEQITKGRSIIEELRDLQLKRGRVEEVDTGFAMQMLTSTPDFSKWYLLQGNKPAGETSDQFCINFEGDNLGVFNYEKHSAMGLLAQQYNKDRAEDACLDVSPSDMMNCASRGSIEKHWMTKGFHFAVNAQASKGKDRQNYTGEFIYTIAANPKTQTFQVFIGVDEGATFPLFRGENFQYMPAVKNSFY